MKRIVIVAVLSVLSLSMSAQPVLPSPLVTSDGKAVKTVRQWERVRRPELMTMFQKEMFGIMPARPSELYFELLSEDTTALGGKATRKEVKVYLDGSRTLYMTLLMYVPNDRKGPVPAFLGANFKGNHGTSEDETILMPTEEQIKAYGQKYKFSERGANARRWPYEYIVSQGYAVVTFCREDVDPDWHDGFANGVHGLLDAGTERPADSWGTIAAWSWGLSRAMDYLVLDETIDSRKVAVFGHSRLGKAALWAGACDERFALVYSNDSGCSGAAISRRCQGETVRVINEKFPHWFCENYHKYGDKEDSLPFDQHELIALIAPRPVYVASASKDDWADPKGEMLSLVYASPVYELYGYDAFVAEDLPPVNTSITSQRMGYHLREGVHDMLPFDWEQFIAFADRFLK